MTSFLKRIYLRNPGITDETYEFSRNGYNSTFSIPKSIMRRVTMRMTHNLSPNASKFWDWFYWFEFANMVVCLTIELMSMAQTAQGGSFLDAIKIFRMLPCSGMVVLGLAKSFMIVYHRPVFENLVNEVGDMCPDGKISRAERNIIRRARTQLIFVMTGYNWCNTALLISFLSPPIIESVKRALGYKNQMILHFFYWLPFDPFQPVYIDILLAIQTWQAIVVIWCNLCGDLLFCAFLSHLTTQFDLLAYRIQILFHVPVDKQLIESYPLSALNKQHKVFNEEAHLDNFNNVDWEKKRQKDVAEIILRHRALIRLCGDVERMFTFALLVNFINSSIIICFCGFCCVLVEKWNEIAYKSFLLTALSQTYLICWYGQKLIDSSIGVSHALYNSGWYTASHKIKSSIIIMLHRARKEVCITTYGFSVVSLKSYMQIIKSAWSYFTLLLNIYKQ